MLSFSVAEKYARGPEHIIAQFNKQDDAKEYIQNKLKKDAALKVAVTYMLYDMGELMQTYDQGHTGGLSDESSGPGSGSTNTQSFRPSPLQTSPRPTGIPPSSFKEGEDDKKK